MTGSETVIHMGTCDECNKEDLVVEFGINKMITDLNPSLVYVCKACIMFSLEKMIDYS
jgi:hypothetical protein